MVECKVCGFKSNTGNPALDIGEVLNHVMKEHRKEAFEEYNKQKGG